MRIHFLLLAFAIQTGTLVPGKAQHTAGQWQVIDLEFGTKKALEAPFDVQFGATFLHEGGKAMEIPGFYNGGKEYLLRFCPPDTGTWTYTTHSSLPGLSGKTGSIEVHASSKEDEHGPLVICPENKHKLSYADGTPYFMLAFELDWLFALDAENPEGIPRSRKIISEIKKNGLNKVVMNVYAYDAPWGDRDQIAPGNNFAEPDIYPFGGSNVAPDHSTLNVDFFKHFDRVMFLLDREEIISHLMIYVWNKKVNWPRAGSPEDKLYFDYVVKRYQAFPNLFWDISKEALGYGRNEMSYISERIDRLRKLDGHQRLLTVHDYGYCAKHPEKVDVISIQNWSPNIYDNTRSVVERHPGKPIFNIEHGGYEKTMHSIFDGAYTDAVTCLERNYHIIFAGAYSTYYWQNASWYEVVWDPFGLPAGQQPNFSYYRHLQALFRKYPFQTLEPVHAGTHALADKDGNYLFLLPEGMIALTGSMEGLKNKAVRVKWFDPLHGTYLDEGQMEIGSWLSIKKPADLKGSFSVLILETLE